jgi:hypothetical protein
MWAKWTAFYNRAKNANAALSLFERVLFAIVFGSAMLAWASTTWKWYWVTYSWAGVALAFLISLVCLSFSFFLTGLGAHYWRGGRSWNAWLRRSVSDQELDYRRQQRKFILSNLDEMLTAYLSVMAMIGDKCGRVVGNGSASQMHWFADYALHRGIRRQYGELQTAATNDFVNISTEAINSNILQFLLEYQNVSSFPEKIERLADLGKTSRDNWDAAHQRCRSALRDLKASSFAGILTESTAMETLQTMPRNR